MNFFRLAVIAMAWTIAALFLALRFFFTVPIVAAISVGLAALLYAMVALAGGTLRVFLGETTELPELVRRAGVVFRWFFLAGALVMLAGVVGEFFGDLFNAGLAVRYVWLGLLVCGLVIQLYAEAAYLRNRG